MKRGGIYSGITLIALALTGCGASTASAPVSAGSRPPVGFALPSGAAHGGEAVLGHNAAAVGSLFGKPRLDVSEGPARKLQFAGSACILDIYFYAPEAGAKPVATHIDARAPNGRDANTGGCIAALKQR